MQTRECTPGSANEIVQMMKTLFSSSSIVFTSSFLENEFYFPQIQRVEIFCIVSNAMMNSARRDSTHSFRGPVPAAHPVRTRITKRSCVCDCGRGFVSVGAFFLAFLLSCFLAFLLSCFLAFLSEGEGRGGEMTKNEK